MAKFYKFSKKQFEYKLRDLLITNKLGFMEEITEQWIEENNYSAEYIYQISTKNKSVKIIVFSSISIHEDKARKCGEDAVRLVLQWKTKNGYVYKKLAKHYRLETLFNNVYKTLKDINVFDLKYKNFSKDYREIC